MTDTKAKSPDTAEAPAATSASSSRPTVSTAEADASAADRLNRETAANDVGKRQREQQVNEKEEELPLCLEYATPSSVPLHLQQLLQQYKNTRLSSAELLLLLIYTVALESGFVENESYVEKRSLLKPVPSIGCFHIYNVRLLSRQRVNYTKDDTNFRMLLRLMLDNSSMEEPAAIYTLQSHLFAVVLGDLMMVTLSPVAPSTEPGFSVCLPIGRYVLNVQLEPIHQRFRKLYELSLQLRQKLFQPMRAQQLLLLKPHMHPSLLGLPVELYDKIFAHLNNNQLNIVANVNKQLRQYSNQFKERRPRGSMTYLL
ncbi:hypothetical protein AWZ03_000018 [Drosophila navojoa]|uniref:F-box domain-containing protein n=1 Tax=Drosophila navojoa TaxID=7232 RepID=A0A484BWX9_DRONA|nr:hypothetical protein AWZ03_000018 [Drosophila navojoa]